MIDYISPSCAAEKIQQDGLKRSTSPSRRCSKMFHLSLRLNHLTASAAYRSQSQRKTLFRSSLHHHLFHYVLGRPLRAFQLNRVL